MQNSTASFRLTEQRAEEFRVQLWIAVYAAAIGNRSLDDNACKIADEAVESLDYRTTCK